MRVKSPLQLAILLFLLFFLTKALSQTYRFKQISEQVTQYNNDGKFDETILLLEEIISNNKATNYDRYHAYFLKYQTYKRLFLYDKAAFNLDLALEEGLKSDKKEIIESQIKFERLFMAFDLLNFDQVNQLLPRISTEDLARVSYTTQGFYYAVLGVVEIKAERLKEAEQYFEKAIVIFEAHDPQNLPMIYRKQIDLYRMLNQYDKSIESFELGLKYAKQYNIDVYIFNMYFDLAYFYKQIGDLDKAIEVQEICNRLAKEYDEGSVLGRLNVLETKLALERIEAEKKRDRTIIISLVGSLFLLVVFLLLLYKYINQIRKNKKQLEEENESLRSNILELLSKTEQETGEFMRLTARQKKIIDLVKQGKTNKEIGSTLFVSENTVKYHLKNIYDVLRVSSRVEL